VALLVAGVAPALAQNQDGAASQPQVQQEREAGQDRMAGQQAQQAMEQAEQKLEEAGKALERGKAAEAAKPLRDARRQLEQAQQQVQGGRQQALGQLTERLRKAEQALEQNRARVARQEVGQVREELRSSMSRQGEDGGRHAAGRRTEQDGAVGTAARKQETDRPASGERAGEQRQAEKLREGTRTGASQGDRTQGGGQQQSSSLQAGGEPAGGQQAGKMDRERMKETFGRTDESVDGAGQVEMKVSEIVGREVRNLAGEELGEVERIVRNGGALYMIVRHGGFLGIGDASYALPLDRVVVSDDQVVLEGLSEEELDSLTTYEGENETALGDEERVTIRGRA
jgi:sporulation protein YlmC with PRC-barrel domain